MLVMAAVATFAAVALASQSPKSLRASIVAAGLAQKSVHWAEHDLVGNALIKSSADVSANSGTQRVTVKVGKETGTIHIVFVSDTAYVEGDAFGLVANLNLTKAQAKQYAGKWISIPDGDKAYRAVSGGLTVASIIHGVAPRGRLKAAKAKVHGRGVFVLEGTKGTGKKRVVGTLVARASGERLPIESLVVDSAHEALARADFSKWNETVKVTAPTSSIPIATVRG
jgi:hypothetical protein